MFSSSTKEVHLFVGQEKYCKERSKDLNIETIKKNEKRTVLLYVCVIEFFLKNHQFYNQSRYKRG
jgi:hypothetical protein